jgi:hypothetical protein
LLFHRRRTHNTLLPNTLDDVTSTSKLETWAPRIAGILFAIPVLLANYPPMTDLALHEAVVAVLRHYGDPKYFPDGLYHLNFGHPNQLFYLVAWPLSFAVGTTWALKIIVAATELALYLAAARFARHMGTPQWTALLVGVLGYGWMFYWGLLANLIGLAVFLAVLPTLDDFVARPTPRGGLAAFLALVLLYLAHESAMLCGCLAVAVFALGHPILSRKFLARLAPALAAFSIGLFHLWWAQRLRPKFNRAMPTIYDPLITKVKGIPGVLFAGYEPAYVPMLMTAITVLAIALFAIERWQERPRIRGTPFRTLLVRYRFETIAAILVPAYLVLPHTLSGSTYFYHRFFAPAYAILAIVLAPRAAAKVWRLPRFAAAIVPLGSLAIAWPSFVDSNRLTRDLDAVIDYADYNSAVMIVDVGAAPGRLFSAAALEGHVMARRGGRTLFDFTRSPIAAAFQSPEYAWDDPWDRMMMKPVLMRPEHDLDHFRYLYFHSKKPLNHLVATVALEPDARLIATRGEWSLFESTHLKHGVMGPDNTLPYPRPHTLRKRMKDVMRKMAGEPIPPEVVQEPPPGWTGPALVAPQRDKDKDKDKEAKDPDDVNDLPPGVAAAPSDPKAKSDEP